MENNNTTEKRDNSMNFLIDDGFKIEMVTITDTSHSTEFVTEMAKRSLKEFKYSFPRYTGCTCFEFQNGWNEGKIEFGEAEKDGIRVHFYRNGNHHNSYLIPYEIGFKYVPKKSK